MSASGYPWGSSCPLLPDRPTLGGLMALCEENYQLLRHLVPDLAHQQGYLRSSRPGGVDLHLELLEQTRYTSLLHLTYYFPQPDGGQVPDPDASLRAYHDAAQVEILELRQTALSISPAASLCAKWRTSLFLSKWLRYCVDQGHRFRRDDPRSGPAAARPLAAAR
jgi:uncharacterized protein YqiB (DUF1249 family)